MSNVELYASENDEKQNNIRYGTSALDIRYSDYAVNDEIMIDKENGKIYYKRKKDGEIVSYEPEIDSIKNGLDNLTHIINKANKDDVVYTIKDKTFFTSNSYDVTTILGKSIDTVICDSPEELSLSFNIGVSERGFFISLDSECNAILKFLYEYNNINDISTKKNIKIKYNVLANNEIIGEDEADVLINNYTYVEFNKDIIESIPEDITSLKVNITYIDCSIFSDIISKLDEDFYNKLIYNLNSGLRYIKLRSIEIITCVNQPMIEVGMDKDNGNKLNFIISSESLLETMQFSGGGGTIGSLAVLYSDNKPNKKCIWLKPTESTQNLI